MKIQLIKLLTTIIIFGSLSSQANAGWLSGLASSIESNSPATYDTQGGTYYSGGGYKFAVESGNLKMFSASAPSIKAGCNGIDIDWGGFKHVNGDDIIKFMKQVVSNSTGYAFNLAMQTLCPQCTDLMNTLGEAANMLNSMDLDSCNVAKAAVNMGGDLVSAAATNMGVTSGLTDSFNDGLKKVNTGMKDLMKGIEDAVDSICLADVVTTSSFECPKTFFMGNATFLQTIFSRSSRLQHLKMAVDSENPIDQTSGLINLVRAFTGDITLQKTEGKGDKEGSVSVVYYPSLHANSTTDMQKAINYWITGEKNKNPKDLQEIGYKFDEVKTTIEFVGKDNGNGSLDYITESFVGISIKNINAIETKFNTRNSLETPQLEFLSTFKSPIYKILNTTSANPQLFKSFIENFKILAGVQLAYETISLITQEMLVHLSLLETEIKKYKLINNDKEFKVGIDSMRKILREMSEYSYSLYADAFDAYNERNRTLDSLEITTKNMQAQLNRHPVISASSSALGVGK